MPIETKMWQPDRESKQYEATGSRTSFSQRWDAHSDHSFSVQEQSADTLQPLLNLLKDEQEAQQYKRLPMLINRQETSGNK